MKRSVASLLLFQILLAPVALQAHTVLLDPPTSLVSAPRHSTDLGWLDRQFRRDYSSPVFVSNDGEMAPAEAALAQDRSLNAYRLEENDVVISSPDRDLAFHYDPNTHELLIHKIKNRTSAGYFVSHTHVFKDADLTATQILNDGTFVHIATPAGLRSVLLANIISDFGTAPLHMPVTQMAQPGTQFSEIQFLNYETTPQKIGAEFFRSDVEILTTIRTLDNHEMPRREKSSYAEMVTNYAYQSALFLLLLQVANPADLDRLALVQNIMVKYAAQFQAAAQKRETQLFSEDRGQGLVAYALSHPETMALLRNTALSSKSQALLQKFFKTNASGQDAFDRAAAAPHHVVFANGNEDSPSDWERGHQWVLEERAKAALEQRPVRTWRQISEENFQNLLSQRPGAVAAEAEMDTTSQAFAGDLIRASQQHATPKRKWKLLAALGAAGATVAAHYLSGGAVGREVLSMAVAMSEGAAKIPLIGGVMSPIAKSLPHLAEAGIFWRWVGGTLICGSLYNVSMWVTQLVSRKSKENRTIYQHYFSFFSSYYGLLSYPTRRLIIEKLLRQHNAYPAMLNGLDSLDPQIFNNPFASNEAIQQKRDEVAKKVTQEAKSKTLALVLAALTVSAASESYEVPIDIATLLQSASVNENLAASDAEKIAAILQQNGSQEGFANLVTALSALLERVGDKGLEGVVVDPAMLDEYLRIFSLVAAGLDRKTSTVIFHRDNLRHELKSRYQQVVKKMSPWAASWLFGVEGLRVYNRYWKNKGIATGPADVAGKTFKHDFFPSQLMGSLADVQGVAAVVTGGGEAARAGVSAMQQVGAYGAFGAIGPDGLGQIKGDLPEGRPPLERDRLNPAAVDASVVQHREQTVLEGIESIWRGIIDPAKTRMMQSHLNYIRNNFTGFKPRFAFDFAFRMPGMMFKLWKDMPWMGPVAMTSFASMNAAAYSINFFNMKYFYLWGTAGLAVGYAVVWPFLHLFTTHMKDAVAENRMLMERAQWMVETSLRDAESEKFSDAIQFLQSLYVFGTEKLPEQFQVPSGEFSYDLGREFLNYSYRSLPLPSKESGKLVVLMNMAIGAFVSATLATQAGMHMFDMAHLDPLGALASVGIWGTATVLGLTGLHKLEKLVVDRLHARQQGQARSQLVRRCEELALQVSTATYQSK